MVKLPFFSDVNLKQVDESFYERRSGMNFVIIFYSFKLIEVETNLEPWANIYDRAFVKKRFTVF